MLRDHREMLILGGGLMGLAVDHGLARAPLTEERRKELVKAWAWRLPAALLAPAGRWRC